MQVLEVSGAIFENKKTKLLWFFKIITILLPGKIRFFFGSHKRNRFFYKTVYISEIMRIGFIT